MLNVQIQEGTLRIEDDKLVVSHNTRSGIFNFFLYTVIGKLFKLEDKILFKDITVVSVEMGKPEVFCPHLLVQYKKNNKEHSRIIEFPIETKTKKCEIKKVTLYLEKKGIQLGIMKAD